MYLHPPPPASDSSSSPEASEEPEVNAILIARDEQNEAYIRNKLRVPDSVPVNLDLVRQRGRERPEASLPTLAMLAIQGCSRSPKELTLNEIAQTIEQHFTWYGDGKTNWKVRVLFL